jgi:asparagine synthase (glutamine-hydrolysing)
MIDKATGTPAGGCFVEVGVYKGGSALHLQKIALAQQRELFLYDTFEGIPHRREGLDSHGIGDFADTSFEDVQRLCPHATVVKGIFPASAVPMPLIAFAHLDCDQYQSVHEAALYLQPRMMAGGVMWFDDSPCLAGARLAVTELYAERLQISSDFGKHYVVF